MQFSSFQELEKPMKKTIFILSFLLLLNSFLSSAAEAPNPVRDTDGKELRSGEEYYVLPVIRGQGGGVTLGPPVNASEVCPLNVVQARRELELGRPVTFRPVNPKKGVIRVSTDLNIKFNAVTICIESNVWKLDYAEEIGQYIIATNGVEGNPGRETLDNWFKIEEDHSDYKIVFCPTVCNFCRPICGDIGIYIDQNGTRRLALSDKPFLVMFKKT